MNDVGEDADSQTPRNENREEKPGGINIDVETKEAEKPHAVEEHHRSSYPLTPLTQIA
jgi:hypothetical protein